MFADMTIKQIIIKFYKLQDYLETSVPSIIGHGTTSDSLGGWGVKLFLESPTPTMETPPDST